LYFNIVCGNHIGTHPRGNIDFKMNPNLSKLNKRNTLLLFSSFLFSIHIRLLRPSICLSAVIKKCVYNILILNKKNCRTIVVKICQVFSFFRQKTKKRKIRKHLSQKTSFSFFSMQTILSQILSQTLDNSRDKDILHS